MELQTSIIPNPGGVCLVFDWTECLVVPIWQIDHANVAPRGGEFGSVGDVGGIQVMDQEMGLKDRLVILILVWIVVCWEADEVQTLMQIFVPQRSHHYLLNLLQTRL